MMINLVTFYNLSQNNAANLEIFILATTAAAGGTPATPIPI